MGFSKKHYANTVLNKYFIEMVYYINLATAFAVARLNSISRERIIQLFFVNDIDCKSFAPPFGGARSDDEKWIGQNIKNYDDHHNSICFF